MSNLYKPERLIYFSPSKRPGDTTGESSNEGITLVAGRRRTPTLGERVPRKEGFVTKFELADKVLAASQLPEINLTQYLRSATGLGREGLIRSFQKLFNYASTLRARFKNWEGTHMQKGVIGISEPLYSPDVQRYVVDEYIKNFGEKPKLFLDTVTDSERVRIKGLWKAAILQALGLS